MQPQSSSLKERHESAWKACREWFGRGKRGRESAEGLVAEFGLGKQEAFEVYQGVFCEIRDEFVEFRKNPEVLACKFYREIRDDQESGWNARLTAQVEMDELLDLPTLAQEPGGQERGDVLEAYEFYHALIDADKPTRHQKLRAQKRLMLLACGRSRRNRSRPAPSRRVQSEEALRRAWRQELVDKAAREPDNLEAQRLAAIATGQSPPVANVSNSSPHVGESNAARALAEPVAHETFAQATPTRADETPAADEQKRSMQDQIREAILNAAPGADPYQVGFDKYMELQSAAKQNPLVATSPSPVTPSSRVGYRSSILPAEWWDAMDAAVAAAPPGADKYKVAVDTYLQLKYPGWKPSDASPSPPESSGIDGQSSDPHARAPPHPDTAA